MYSNMQGQTIDNDVDEHACKLFFTRDVQSASRRVLLAVSCGDPNGHGNAEDKRALCRVPRDGDQLDSDVEIVGVCNVN